MCNTAYDRLIKKINKKMLVSQDDRVTLLREILIKLGHPDLNYKIIHLAGTNGKGSTGTMLAKSLENAGYKVGHFSSPALLDQREQIKVNGIMISKTDFVKLYEEIKVKLPPTIQPESISIFEWFTLIMLQYFANQEVDWAIIEAGLGGENDATNIITSPKAVVFTHIDFDHVKILGPTLAKITQNKAGIIKKDAVVLIAPKQEQSVLKILHEQADRKQAKRVIESNSILVKKDEFNFEGNTITVQSANIKLKKVKFKLVGDYQLDNLTTVIAVYEWLLDAHFVNDISPLVSMMQSIQIPGRFQILSQNPVVILDGAHNVDGTKALIKTLNQVKQNRPLFFILGFLKDKNYPKMLELYDEIADKIFAVQPDNEERALNPKTIVEILKHKNILNAQDVHQALHQALHESSSQAIIVVSGSFYLIKELEGFVVGDAK